MSETNTAKASGKATSSPASNGEAVKKTSNHRNDGGLTKQHVRILSFMLKAGKPVPVPAIIKAVGVTGAMEKTVRWSLGSIKPDNRDPLSLQGRGCVRQRAVDVDGVTDHVYEITASGKAALAKHGKEQAAKAAAAK